MNAKTANSVEERISQLEALVAEIQAKLPKPKGPGIEMTEEHARSVLYGDLADKSHKDAAAALGLSYGQVYSCRLKFTFKGVHKDMKDQGIKNRWVK